MAEANLPITAGSGTNIDTYSVTGAGGATAYRQAVVLADPTTAANTATVTAANALKVDGSAVTQPVSGTVTATAGTNLNTSALALETGGNLATVAGAVIAQEATTSGVKGMTAFGAVTTAKPTYTTAKSDALSLDTSGLLRVSLADTPANGTKLLVTPDSVALPSNQSVNASQINGVTPLMGNGVTGTGSLRVTIASDNTAFTSNAAQSGTWTVQPGNTANTTPWLVTTTPGTTGGWSASSKTALTNTVASVKSSAAGTFGGYQIGNPNTVVAYIQVFDAATTGAVTLGSTAPTYVFSIPGNGTATVAGAANIEFGNGINHASGIQVAATTTPTGSTALSNTCCALFLYK